MSKRNWYHDCIAAAGGVSLAGMVNVCPFCGITKDKHETRDSA